ncbi:MAG: MT-A70 family methyltransferase [Lentisphaeria bacterium]|nr:MT-A70 family methyltransferase [Lentisphaeria bacterium]
MKSKISIEETIASFCQVCAQRKFRTILADPPWQFNNRTGKVAPEHKRLNRYPTLCLDDIKKIPVQTVAEERCHLYLWVPNALLPEGLEVMRAWGFEYKTNLIWEKVRKDGYPDGRGVGFYFRNVTEILLFGIRGDSNRTLAPARRQVNIIRSMKREHSRKPDEVYDIIETCSEGAYLEMFARGARPNWVMWGNQADENYAPDWATYRYSSRNAQPTGDLFLFPDGGNKNRPHSNNREELRCL